jgi:hypothetical protein
MNIIRNIVREELGRLMFYEQQDGLSQFEKDWGGFVLDTSDYSELDLSQLYKEGVDHITHNLKTKDFIYRGMSVNDEWLNLFMSNNSIRLGIFWSFDKAISKSFTQATDIYDDEFSMFKGKNKLIITAKTPEHIDYIDVNATVAHNIISYEDELRLFKDIPLEVVSIYFNGKELEFNNKKLMS